MSTSPSPQYDVVVVGTRPAGCRHRTGPGPCRDAGPGGGSRRVWRRHSLDPRPPARCRAAARPLRAARSGRRRRHSTGAAQCVPLRRGPNRRTDQTGLRRRRSLRPRRTVLDPILVDAARDASAEVRFGVAVTDLRRDGNGRVTGIVGRDERGSSLVVGARITIGADGMGSMVSRLAGAPTDRVAANAAAFIYGYWDGLPGRDYELFYQPGVTAGFFPPTAARPVSSPALRPSGTDSNRGWVWHPPTRGSWTRLPRAAGAIPRPLHRLRHRL
jgi:2-polyprenyl-6-methoxyphenol hydroxylase-like FAD-dependent oxidoreductase